MASGGASWNDVRSEVEQLVHRFSFGSVLKKQERASLRESVLKKQESKMSSLDPSILAWVIEILLILFVLTESIFSLFQDIEVNGVSMPLYRVNLNELYNITKEENTTDSYFQNTTGLQLQPALPQTIRWVSIILWAFATALLIIDRVGFPVFFFLKWAKSRLSSCFKGGGSDRIVDKDLARKEKEEMSKRKAFQTRLEKIGDEQLENWTFEEMVNLHCNIGKKARTDAERIKDLEFDYSKFSCFQELVEVKITPPSQMDNFSLLFRVRNHMPVAHKESYFPWIKTYEGPLGKEQAELYFKSLPDGSPETQDLESQVDEIRQERFSQLEQRKAIWKKAFLNMKLCGLGFRLFFLSMTFLVFYLILAESEFGQEVQGMIKGQMGAGVSVLAVCVTAYTITVVLAYQTAFADFFSDPGVPGPPRRMSEWKPDLTFDQSQKIWSKERVMADDLDICAKISLQDLELRLLFLQVHQLIEVLIACRLSQAKNMGVKQKMECYLQRGTLKELKNRGEELIVHYQRCFGGDKYADFKIARDFIDEQIRHASASEAKATELEFSKGRKLQKKLTSSREFAGALEAHLKEKNSLNMDDMSALCHASVTIPLILIGMVAFFLLFPALVIFRIFRETVSVFVLTLASSDSTQSPTVTASPATWNPSSSNPSNLEKDDALDMWKEFEGDVWRFLDDEILRAQIKFKLQQVAESTQSRSCCQLSLKRVCLIRIVIDFVEIAFISAIVGLSMYASFVQTQPLGFFWFKTNMSTIFLTVSAILEPLLLFRTNGSVFSKILKEDMLGQLAGSIKCSLFATPQDIMQELIRKAKSDQERELLYMLCDGGLDRAYTINLAKAGEYTIVQLTAFICAIATGLAFFDNQNTQLLASENRLLPWLVLSSSAFFVPGILFALYFAFHFLKNDLSNPEWKKEKTDPRKELGFAQKIILSRDQYIFRKSFWFTAWYGKIVKAPDIMKILSPSLRLTTHSLGGDSPKSKSPTLDWDRFVNGIASAYFLQIDHHDNSTGIWSELGKTEEERDKKLLIPRRGDQWKRYEQIRASSPEKMPFLLKLHCSKPICRVIEEQANEKWATDLETAFVAIENLKGGTKKGGTKKRGRWRP